MGDEKQREILKKQKSITVCRFQAPSQKQEELTPEERAFLQRLSKLKKRRDVYDRTQRYW